MERTIEYNTSIFTVFVLLTQAFDKVRVVTNLSILLDTNIDNLNYTGNKCIQHKHKNRKRD